MLKGSYSEAISIAVAGIGAIPLLETWNVSSVRLGVVLRLLNSAGWDVFDISEVVPDYPTSNGKVDSPWWLSSPEERDARHLPRCYWTLSLRRES